MNENEQNRNYIDIAKLISSSTYLNNLLELTKDIPDSQIDIPLATRYRLEKENQDVYKALEQYNVLVHIIGAVNILSSDIETEIGTLCDSLLEMELL